MKKTILVLGILALVIAGFFYVIGCGTLTGGGDSAGGYFFYTNTSNTTPVFKPSSTSTQALGILNIRATATSEWGAGNALYPVYFSLREFLSARDEGKVDRSNLYKLLIDVDSVFSGITPEAQSITEQEITPPFSNLQKVTCNKAVNDTANKRAIALKDTTAEVAAVISWIWSDSPQKNEYGIASLIYDKATEEITVDMSYSVDYDVSNPETEYNLRCNVTGNALQDAFQFKYIIGDTIKIVAKGISRGAGNYMLFKYTGFGSAVKYIVVPGDADEDFFKAQNTNPTLIYDDADNLPSSVEAYKTWVVNTDFLTTAEVVSNINTLNSGTTNEGTIYINYTP